jgi:iduronate 2-sulfatase
MAAPGKMNVLFFAVDDLNNHVGTYGHPVKSPNIDALATSGVRFDRAYCQYPLCNPSRTSLLTGMRPPRTHVTGNVTWFREAMPDVVTLPQHFRENGYYTAMSGKIFHDGLNDDKGWVDGSTPLQKRTPRPQAVYAAGADRWQAVDSEEDQLDYRIATEAIEHLEKRPQSQPFFIACGFHKPHVPFVAPKKYFDLYNPDDVQLPKDFAGMPTGTGPAYRANFDLFVNREATVPLAHEAIRAYHACTSFTDAQVGRVLAALDRLHLRDNTAIVLIADHGWHLGEKGMWAKLTLFEPSARVPLIISAPRMAAGKGCMRTVESLDVYPTLADLCGLKAPAVLEGKSLRPLLEDPAHPWDRPAYSFLHRGPGNGASGVSVRTEQYRYTEWDGGRSGAELYDYDKDPTESRNLAAESAQASTVKKMKELLRSA